MIGLSSTPILLVAGLALEGQARLALPAPLPQYGQTGRTKLWNTNVAYTIADQPSITALEITTANSLAVVPTRVYTASMPFDGSNGQTYTVHKEIPQTGSLSAVL